MVKHDAGHIVNIGSTAATYPSPGRNVYAATKAFVRQFSLNLKADLIGTKLRVPRHRPRPRRSTEFSTVRFRGDQDRADRLYDGLDTLTPDDIADAVSGLRAVRRTWTSAIELMPVAGFRALVVNRGLVTGS